MSTSERKKISRELGIKLSDVTDDVVSDYRKVSGGKQRKVPNVVLNIKEMVSAIRVFNKKSYTYHGFRENKTVANRDATKLRGAGYLVRIVPGKFKGKKIYNLYKARGEK